ncbi:hypothetical protein [Sphingopyxis sp. MWB1]|uniref:hypothetical protein n=1 Tax=Sphingopyxis sp. MWB1 TaxID=1537715 RepID=UPI00190F972B|nr:hypothetical protein [Sphingopyxis sp. MWB1]
MNSKIYRLTEWHRRIDEALRREMRRRGADPLRLLRLRHLKQRVKERLHRSMRSPAFG